MTTPDNGKTTGSRYTLDPNLKIGKPDPLNDPKGYIPEPGLKAAVEVALQLGEPLLVSGDPGTGKTGVAGWIADQLKLPEPLKFETSSTSTAIDLFYTYNALGHFHASRDPAGKVEARNFIAYQALGKAIILSNRQDDVKKWLPDFDRKEHGGEPKRAVVLIDEIDKAPRDFPNDILNQIEMGYFRVPEIGPEAKIEMNRKYQPIVVITSNSEKNLPEAFLRRCIYYDIPFPDEPTLKEIIFSRIKRIDTLGNSFVDEALHFFDDLRTNVHLDRPPATAELLNWLLYMVMTSKEPLHHIALYHKDNERKIVASFSILAKTQNDLKKVREHYAQHPKHS